MNKILVVAAHPDDEVLGVGGTIRKKVNNGSIAHCLILGEGLTSRGSKRNDTQDSSIGELHSDAIKASQIIGYQKIYFASLPDNRFDSVDLLDVVKIIEKYIADMKPDTIYTHYRDDLNIDHKITHEAVLTTCRPIGTNIVSEIYAFETPSSTEWGKADFRPNVFEDITDTIESKLNAMEAYKTEIREYPHPRSLKALEIIAARWGTVVGQRYTEAFELIRSIR